jgi:hypothetical protein
MDWMLQGSYAMQHPPAPGQPCGPAQRSGLAQPNCPQAGGAALPIFDFEISLFRLVLWQPGQVRPLILSLPATMCSHTLPQSAH